MTERDVFTLNELAKAITDNDLPAMAKLLNDHAQLGGSVDPEPGKLILIARWAVQNLAQARAGDMIGRAAAAVLQNASCGN